MSLSAIGETLADFQNGRPVVLVRDEEHSAEGYLLAAAEKASAESLAFLLRHGPGLLGLAMTPERLDTLGIIPTPFDQSVAPFFTSGPSALEGDGEALARAAEEHAAAVHELIQLTAGQEALIPERIVPLRAAWGGLLVCPTPVEAALDLARLAGLRPVGLVCKLAAHPADAFAARHGLKTVAITRLIEHCRRQGRGKLVRLPVPARLPTRYGIFSALVYEEPLTGLQHMVLMRGEVGNGSPVLTRIHSECLTGDALGSLRCDCGPQLDLALKRIAEAGHGVLLYLRQEGRGIGLYNKLKTYTLQEQGLDTVEANERLGFPPDLRDYGIAGQILSDLGVREIRLLTNNPKKVRSLEDGGMRVVERVPLIVSASPESSFYLQTKREKMDHLLAQNEPGPGLLRFVVLAAPRTGSNWLCTLLDSHPEILCHHEIFNPERILYSLSCRGTLDLGTLEERDRDPLSLLDQVWRADFGYRAVGFKLNRGQNEMVFRAVLADRDVRKILIRRDNRIKTYVSEMIAQRTGEWESYPGIELSRQKANVAVDLASLRRHIELNEGYYNGIYEALRATGQTWLDLSYEKLATEDERARLLRFLSVTPDIRLREATRKQNPEDLRELIANFSELGAQLRGTELEAELTAPGL
jgi:3,4-dihydroxy 2-butanone 4-phosphate synthase / GTP cyclohydrolase II